MDRRRHIMRIRRLRNGMRGGKRVGSKLLDKAMHFGWRAENGRVGMVSVVFQANMIRAFLVLPFRQNLILPALLGQHSVCRLGGRKDLVQPPNPRLANWSAGRRGVERKLVTGKLRLKQLADLF